MCNSRYWKIFFPVFICWVHCVVSVAQQKDTLLHHELSDVEIVEKRIPSVIRQAAPVQLIDQSRIGQLGLQELSEAVKRFSGVTVKDYGGIGGLKTVSVRSLGAQHTAVSYDGITISDAQNGQIDISRFSLDNVESIALSIGQADDIFQSARFFASAGALSIRTETPVFRKKTYHLKANVQSGSFGLFNPSLRYEQKLSNHYAFTFHTDWLRADGQYPYTYYNGNAEIKDKRKNSDIKTFRSELNLFADWKKNGELRVKGYWFDSHRGLPGSVIFRNDYHAERLKNKNGFIQAAYENRFSSKLAFKGLAKFDYAWTRYKDFHSTYPDGVQTDVYTQREYYGSASLQYTPIKNLSFTLAEDFFVNTLDATTPKCPFPTRYTSLTAFGAQYQNSRLTATASLLNTFITEELEIGDPADDRKRLSPAFSMSYRILPSENLRVRVSYKDIFRSPTFNDLYYDRMGNKELESEKALQYNAGITWSSTFPGIGLDYISLSADGYYNRVKDKIVALPTMFIWKMLNMGRVNIKGTDINLSTRFALPYEMFLQMDGNYTFQDATDATEKGSKIYGHQIPYTPRHTGNMALTWENPWVNISWLITIVGERYMLAQNIEANRIEGYNEQQLSFNRDFKVKNTRIRLNAQIINLGNVSYDIIRYYPMPGRSFRAGVQIIY